MKLTRLRVAELRQFRAPFELAGIQPGLNIFTGPNEAGKSTLVRALRAAFFERHRSTSVDDLRPYGDSAAAPVVELDFDIADMPYRLTKSFLQKKRCELVFGKQRLEGVEAEDALAERLGFQFALKGASREQHWGIPGLLWIEQGSGQAVRDAVLHASDHLRKALDTSLGEVSASGGDEVVTQVRAWRDELLTAGTGKPKAALLKAIDDAARLGQRVAELQQGVARYRSQVDQLKALRDAHGADAAAQPWTALRVQQATAQQSLQAAQALAGEQQRAQTQLRQLTGLRDLLLQRLAADQQQQQDLVTREAALVAAAARHAQAVAAEGQAALTQDAAAARWQLARQAQALARQEDSRRQHTRQAADAQARSGELGALLERASAENDRAAALRRDAAPLRIEVADLSTLRAQHTELHDLRIRQDAAATRLRFELDPGAIVGLDGDTLSGNAERLLTAPAVLTLPGIGRVYIAPGGSDLAELAQTQARLQHTHGALLQRLGLAGLPDAEARVHAHGQKLADAEAADKARKLLAPKGLDALRTELDAALARATAARAALAQLPAASATSAAVLSLDVVDHQHDSARIAAEAAGQQLQAARQALATAASQAAAALHERDTLKAALEQPQLQAELARKQAELLESGARQSALDAEIAVIAHRIAEARPDILQQDVERFRRSADEAQNQHNERDRQIVQLETALAAAGAQGLEEELDAVTSAHTQAQRRATELRRRADALDHLLRKLEQRRQALTRRLQAPLQKHLDRYLQLLFPVGRLEVDDNLVPGALTRPSPRGPEAGDFDTLSFGAREQMGVISRLAYADLLKEAGRPTLIILDDALVHSDEQRLAQMKRVLFDAAQRHQVLLFTCHAGNWRDMGVLPRSLQTAP